MLLSLLALACTGGPAARPDTFACGKLICDSETICLHFTPADTAAPPDANHLCVEAPAACDGLPTCACAGDVCLSDCDDAGDGVDCTGDEP